MLRKRRKKLDPQVARTVPRLRTLCEGAGVSYRLVSRALGPENWPLLYLNACCRWSQRQLARAYHIAPSLICRRLQRMRRRLEDSSLFVGPARHSWIRVTTFTDCAGREREELLLKVYYFERAEKFRRSRR